MPAFISNLVYKFTTCAPWSSNNPLKQNGYQKSFTGKNECAVTEFLIKEASSSASGVG